MEMIHYINSSPYFVAFVMLTMNIGGRFLVMEIPQVFERIFEHPIARKCILFSIFFMASRDIRIALLLTLFVTIIFHYLLKEDSIYSILPDWLKDDIQTRKTTQAIPPQTQGQVQTQVQPSQNAQQTNKTIPVQIKEKQLNEQPNLKNNIYGMQLDEYMTDKS
jgi:hypothetical protein